MDTGPLFERYIVAKIHSQVEPVFNLFDSEFLLFPGPNCLWETMQILVQLENRFYRQQVHVHCKFM